MHLQDSPYGDYRDLKKNGVMSTKKGNLMATMKCAFSNYRLVGLVALFAQ